MKPTQTLKIEHELISVAVRILDAVRERLEAKRPVPASHVEALIDFFRLYTDKLHHGKEEYLLFEELLKRPEPQVERLIASLSTQHVIGRELVRGMAEAALGVAQGNRRATKSFCDDAKAYTTLLRIHICDEDHVAFPLADKHLTPYQQGQLTKRFRQGDATLMTAQVAKLAESIWTLAGKYGLEDAKSLAVPV